MFGKLHLIDAISQKVGRLGAGAVFPRYFKGTDETLPLGQSVGLEKIEQSAGVTDVAMPILQNEIDPRFLRLLDRAGELQFRGHIGGCESEAGPEATLAPAGSSLKALGASIGVDKIELPPGQIEPQVSPGDFLKTRPYVTLHQSASPITWSGVASFNIS